VTGDSPPGRCPVPEASGPPGDPFSQVRARYAELLGTVPAAIEQRLALAGRTGRGDSVLAIEALRQAVIMNSPLGRQVGQLVHFGQLLALGRSGPARRHARAARRAGASLAQLPGVAELALITAGVPAYSLGVEILTEIADEEPGPSPDGPAGG